MEKSIITTDKAPAAIGPYSQAVRTTVRELLFVSGQIPLDPVSGSLVQDDIQAQTRQVLENLKAVLTAGGASLQQVVKVTVFLSDMNDFAAMNEVYATYFSGNPPARACVQVARLPRDVGVEIEAIAVI